jgi:hypothetical protein
MTTTTTDASITPSPSPSTQPPPTTSATQAVGPVTTSTTTTTTIAPVVVPRGRGPPTIVLKRLPGSKVTDKEVVKKLAVFIEVNGSVIKVKKSNPTELEIEIDTGDPKKSEKALNKALALNKTELSTMGAAEINYIIRQEPAEFDWLPIILGSVGGLLLLSIIIFLLTRKKNDEDENGGRVASVQIQQGVSFSANPTNDRGIDDQPLLEIPKVALSTSLKHDDLDDL